MREFRLIYKSAQISTKVKGLGSPLRAEPSGSCCRSGKLRLPAKSSFHFYKVRTMQRRHHRVGSINQRLIKLKQGQKTAFPFPLMVSPWLCKRQALISSLNPPHSLPFFIPPHFACRRRPDPIHLFVPFSIAMFTGFNFTQFFYLYFFGYLVSNFIKVSITLCYQILLVTSSICCLFCLTLRCGLVILFVALICADFLVST